MFPFNRVTSPNYSEKELEKRTKALIASGGPWEKLSHSKNKLIYYARCNIFAEDNYTGTKRLPDKLPENFDMMAPKKRRRDEEGVNQKLKLYRDDFTEEVRDVDDVSGGRTLVSLLSDRWSDGPGAIVGNRFYDREYAPDVVENARMLIHSFEKVVSPDRRPAVIPAKDSETGKDSFWFPSNRGTQTRRETLANLIDEYEKWMHANADVIPLQDQHHMRDEIKSYRKNYKQILEYVDYAKEYLAHIDGKKMEIKR